MVHGIADSDVLRLVLKKEAARRVQILPDQEQRQRIEQLMTLATMVGGLLPRSDGFAFLSATDVGPLLPVPDLIEPRVYRDAVAATNADPALAGLQPDILGERFVLDRLTAGDGSHFAARKLLVVGWKIQPDDVCDFVVRTASDFPGDPGLEVLCALPTDSPLARSRWGRLVADLIRVANRSTDPMTGRLLSALRELVRKHSDEEHVARALALAELYLGNIFLFAEENYSEAQSRFEAAIALARGASDIVAAAVNNRGIVYHLIENEDKAFADWSDVISASMISDEARACALNNRADVFGRRGLHEQSIADRAAVLALRETSADRRYIALIRRSRSYVQLGRSGDALDDLGMILRTDDISPQQKAEAHVLRGALLRDLGHLDDARQDLDSVLAEEDLFYGTYPEALVELGELARLTGDVERAREYLDAASASVDARGDTLAEALIVRARLLTDEGDAAAAESIWQRVRTDPAATPRQALIASNRDVPARLSHPIGV
ncbi:MAG TPA: hypothetical protein VHO06_04885 [Polyangia bacterium]|nr:hypothetical protein [Polyangia bacterium]